MKKYLWTFVCLVMVSVSTNAQNAKEINAFEKINKELLKQLKKTYGAKTDVNQTPEGEFYIVLTKKENKVEKYLLTNESGELIYDTPVDSYKVIDGGYVYLGIKNVAGQFYYGAFTIKGKMLLPIKYSEISHSQEYKEDQYTNSNTTYWHPASPESWMVVDDTKSIPHITFYNADATLATAEYNGKVELYKDFYRIISPTTNAINQKGLLTIDGRVIFPQEYNRFFLFSNGFMNCMKKDGINETMGGKMIKTDVTDIEVPCIFDNVRLNSSNKVICRAHCYEDYQEYNPDSIYTITWKDDGEKYLDAMQYEKVITFYEGEGYGAVWGNYYMGLASKQLGDNELKKMDKCINTLKSESNYYLPIKRPDDYKFDAGTITTMYLSAINYFEKYMNSSEIPENDPTKVKARKLRGELVTSKNNMSKKIEEYGSALHTASEKNAQREAQIAAQQAQQQQAANALATGLTNLLFGGSKKK